MSNLFDGLSDGVFRTVSVTMGYDASWAPIGGGSVQTARVLFKEPTDKDDIGEYGDSYDLRTFFMEFWITDFVGLFDSVREDGEETVTITFPAGDREFYIREIKKKFDGRNYKARLEEILA